MLLYGTNPIAWSNDDDPNLGGHISLDQCLDDAARIGFDGIEKGNKFPTEPDALRAVLQPRGLQFVSGWHSLNLLVNDIETEKATLQTTLDLFKAMGSNVVITCETSNSVHGNDSVALKTRPQLHRDDWPGFGSGIEALAEFSANQGMQLVYHPHMGTVVETEEEYDLLMEHTGPQTKLLLDTGHCFFGGGDPVAVAERYMSRVGHIHTKNIRPEIMRQVHEESLSFLEAVRRGVFTVPGDEEGIIDFEPVLAIAASHDYQGWLVIEAEQDPDQRNPFAYQSLGLNTLVKLAKKVGLDRNA